MNTSGQTEVLFFEMGIIMIWEIDPLENSLIWPNRRT